MKNKIVNAMIHLTLATVCVFIVVGTILADEIVLFVLGMLFTFLCLYFLMHCVCHIADVITLCIKRKKKTQDKRIKLKVTFIRNHDANASEVEKIFSAKDLATAVQYVLSLAHRMHCQIKSMEQLTTED